MPDFGNLVKVNWSYTCLYSLKKKSISNNTGKYIVKDILRKYSHDNILQINVQRLKSNILCCDVESSDSFPLLFSPLPSWYLIGIHTDSLWKRETDDWF